MSRRMLKVVLIFATVPWCTTTELRMNVKSVYVQKDVYHVDTSFKYIVKPFFKGGMADDPLGHPVSDKPVYHSRKNFYLQQVFEHFSQISRQPTR